MSDLPQYNLERVFDAPRDLVWTAWTDKTHLERWYGPGVESHVHELDIRPGGRWLNEMRMGGNSMFQIAVFQEVREPQLLIWHHSSSDEAGNVTDNPMMPDWPRTLLTRAEFLAEGDRTKLLFSWIPHEASDAQIEAFSAAVAKMGGGWEMGFKIIDDILAEMQT